MLRNAECVALGKRILLNFLTDTSEHDPQVII